MRFLKQRSSGFTLVELMVTTSVMGILLSYAVPKFKNAFEQARANVAASNLQAIWAAERQSWAINAQFTTLSNLSSYMDPALYYETQVISSTGTYLYAVTSNDTTSFTATATRQNSSMWSGTLTIDQTGAITGTITDSYDASTVSPASTY